MGINHWGGIYGPNSASSEALVGLNPLDYGAVGDGVTDDTAALQALALQVHTAGGGVIVMPAGHTFIVAGQLNFSQYENVSFIGQASMPRTNSPSTIQFTRADNQPCVILGSSNSLRFKGIRFRTTNAAYSGWMFQCAATAFADCQMLGFEDCNIRMTGTTANGISLLHAVGATIRRCNFTGGAVQVRGSADPAGTAITTAGYAIGVTIDGQCQFGNASVANIQNPDFDWNIIGDIFSPGPGGIANSITNDGVRKNGTAVTIQGCYFGDAGSGTYVRVGARGLVVNGNYFDGVGAVGLVVEEPTYGGLIAGNTFNVTTGIDFQGVGLPTQGVAVTANDLVRCTNTVLNHTAVNSAVTLSNNHGIASRYSTAPAFAAGLNVNGTAGFTVDSSGNITMGSNRTVRGDYFGDRLGTQVNLEMAVNAGQAVTARSKVTTRIPLVAEAVTGTTVDLMRATLNGVTYWKVTKEGAAVARSYTTATRPSAATVGAGAQIYDTDLGIPIWSNGSAWRDAAGVAV